MLHLITAVAQMELHQAADDTGNSKGGRGGTRRKEKRVCPPTLTGDQIQSRSTWLAAGWEERERGEAEILWAFRKAAKIKNVPDP